MKTEKFIVSSYENNIDVNVNGEYEYIKTLTENSKNKELQKIDWSKCELVDTHFEIEAEWLFTIEMRSWGVKTLSAYGTAIAIKSLQIDYIDQDGNDKEVNLYWTDGHFPNSYFDDNDFEIETEGGEEGQYRLTEITIDFDDKTIITNFN
jgi:hypothetical protein